MSLEDLQNKKASESTPEAEQPRAPTVREALDALQRHEDLTVPGARSRMPKELMMDAPEARAHEANKDKHLRMVAAGNVASRKLDGYEIVPLAEGGKDLAGHAVLMRLPKHIAEARKKNIEKQNAEKLTAHKKEAEGIAEGLSKMLRDKHGLNIPAERILQE